MLSDPRTKPFLHQVELNANLQLMLEDAAKKAVEDTAENIAKELRKIREDFFNPPLKAQWVTLPPLGTINVSQLLEGRWNFYKIVLLSTSATLWPSSVELRGIDGAQSVWVTQAVPMIELNFPIWDTQSLVVINNDAANYARVLLEFKKGYQSPAEADQS